MKKLSRGEKISGLRGRGIKEAYPAGLIGQLMAAGRSYEEAKRLARSRRLSREETGNLVVTAGKVLTARFLYSTPLLSGINYCAIGTGASAPAAADTSLAAEAARKYHTRRARVGTEVTLETFFTAAECSYNITEVGWFGGDATGAADSGQMFSHFLQSESNAGGSKDLTFSYVVTVE